MNKIEKEYLLVKRDRTLKSLNKAYNPLLKTEVLIFCYTYNHEKYIAECLNGMINQLVNFNVKIIVHDDNSTDSTLKIVNEYAKRYPNLIEVISQKKNLYDPAHGLLPIFCFLRKFHEGNFIAVCEGDDYWTDPYKIAFQKKVMEHNPKLSFCTHKVNVMDDKTKEITRTIPARKFKLRSGIIDSQNFVELTSIRYPFQTSSYFFRTIDFSNYLDNLPDFAKIMPTEDEGLLLFFGQLGDTLYIDKPMSTYRKFSEGSWSNDHKNSTSNHQGNARLERMIESVKKFDEYTDFRFHEACGKRIIKHEFRILMNNGHLDKIFNNKQLRIYFRTKYPKDYWSYKVRRLFKK